MANLDAPKLLARNVAALRRFVDPANIVANVTGNPALSRLESGVGNCFPGLECDLRNLERRFLPFLEVDFPTFGIGQDTFRQLFIPVSVDLPAMEQALVAGDIAEPAAQAYREIAAAIAAGEFIVGVGLTGTFGILGDLALDLTALNDVSTGVARQPPDGWTAVRMLTEGTDVEVTFVFPGTPRTIVLSASRARYLDDNGALSSIFLPGELTQSLCSPWTHDFRDCGCFYWASNHPDIVQPVYPAATPPADPQPWTTDVAWQRRDRQVTSLPPAGATAGATAELRHYEINRRWQELHFVIGRRETTLPFKARALNGKPLTDAPTLLRHLRYAAGVELGVAHEYLTAAYSLKPDNDPSLAATPQLRNDVRATRSELMRIAIGEMRHTRAVNDVIRAMMPPGTFTPALQVASLLPEAVPGVPRPVVARPASKAAIDDFIIIEAPSAGVDGLYFDILATLDNPPPDVAPFAAPEWSEAISSVIAEGEDHYQTFLDLKEWLDAYPETAYLRSAQPVRPAPGQADHDALQVAYRTILEDLHTGYTLGRFAGASQVNAARSNMITSLDPLAHAVASQSFLVVFDDIADPRFSPIGPP